ncbi:F-box family protein [Melia azedarach]|uniref:F-box family protein n=1 Tax=Melia azedarach TaxID=155640 RepID=A0ACC1XWV0_MELAZ|nr:F-box family protein [Melia azedarach]
MATSESSGKNLDRLPGALLCTIMTKLDVASICSVAATCTTFRTCVSQILSFLTNFNLLDIAPSMEIIRPLLPPNPYLRSLKNCADFSGKLLSEIGGQCKDLRSLYLGSVAEKRGRSIHISDLEELLNGCPQLEALVLIPNVEPHQLPNQIRPFILPSIQKLCLSVDYITDAMVGTISQGLVSLTHLDLRDTPLIEPRITFDLTNSGLQQINHHGKLKHLSLIRSQEFVVTYFRRVNDLGILLMADKCANMESICLGGFCRVTDTGFKTILHSCSNLCKLRVSHGTQLTDLVFHDISATSLSLMHVCLRWCNLLTNNAIKSLVSNTGLKVLDLRDCKNLGDEALRAISCLPQLKILLLDGSDISDAGMSYLRHGIISSLVTLSLRGCKRLTDKCISVLFDGSSKLQLQELDLSNLPNLSDNGILTLAKSRVPISELRVRQCPLIGDTSIIALASMQVDDDRWYGSSIRLLDLYKCGGITPLAFRWLKKPYFPKLRWLGVTGSVNRDIVDALARSRPFLNVACRGEELGVDQWDNSDSMYMHDYGEVDELEEWLYEGEDESDDEEMAEAEINAEPMV